MLFRMMYDDKLAAATYLLGCQKTGECVIVDPLRDVDRYIERAKKEGMRITAVTETHIHADFLSGSRELGSRTGATIYLSAYGGDDWSYRWNEPPHKALKDGDSFKVGNIELKAMHTPGHTPEHICFLVIDHGSGVSDPMGILSGDFLFVGDVGRPDLLESAAGIKGMADQSAKQLFQTLGKLKTLPEWLQVWPAHGAGSACGKALGAVPQSTVGYESRFNPSLRAASSEAAFVKYILSEQPEPPMYFARMKHQNRDGPRLLGALPAPKRLAPDELPKIDASKVAIIDTRSWDAFRAGHIPGSLFFPLNNSFTTDVGSMVTENEDIVLIVAPERLDEAVRDLVHIGLDRVVGWCEPESIAGLAAKGVRLVPSREMGVPEVQKLIAQGLPVLDVRRAAENAQVRIAGSLNISHTRLLGRLEEVPRGEVVVHCLAGGRSARACALLERRGDRPINLAGGISAWEKAGASVQR